MASTASLSPDDLEHAVGDARLLEQFGQDHGGRGYLLRHLEDETVAAGQGDGEHPHRHHGREVERRNPGDDAERLAQGMAANPRADVLGDFALQQLRRAGGELDHLDPARSRPGVGVDLAMLGGDGLGEPRLVLLQQPQEAVEDAGAAQGRGHRPGREGGAGEVHRVVTTLASGTIPLCSPVADCRPPLPAAGDGLAADEMMDLGRHDATSAS